MKYITRHPLGWLVRVSYRDKTENRVKFFSSIRSGREKSLEKAKRWIKRVKTDKIYRMKRGASKASTTGIKGVYFFPHHSIRAWIAHHKVGDMWRHRYFYITKKRSYEEAKAAAIAFRKQFEARYSGVLR